MEKTVSSETSAIRTQMLVNYPKRNTLHLEHSESLKTRKSALNICLHEEMKGSMLIVLIKNELSDDDLAK